MRAGCLARAVLHRHCASSLRRLAHGAKPLVITAPAAPGGGWDQTARAMQRVLAEIEPGVSVQVDNVPGAAGTIGLARFIQSERGNPDALLVTGLVMVSGVITQRLAGLARRHDADRAPHRRIRSHRRSGLEPVPFAGRSDRRVQEESRQRVVGRRIGGRHRRSARAAARGTDRTAGIERELHRLRRRRRGARRGARRTAVGGGQRLRGIRGTDCRGPASRARGVVGRRA